MPGAGGCGTKSGWTLAPRVSALRGSGRIFAAHTSGGTYVPARLYVDAALSMVSIVELISGIASPLYAAKVDMTNNAHTLQMLADGLTTGCVDREALVASCEQGVWQVTGQARQFKCQRGDAGRASRPN